MELRTLRYFLAVAREENMTEAANVLHVTQPTLSRRRSCAMPLMPPGKSRISP